MNRTPLKSYRRCSFCGCRNDRPCLVRGVPCHWVGPRLCSNPGCVERARQALRREAGERPERAEGGEGRPKPNRPRRPCRYVTRDGREIYRSPWAWLLQRKAAWQRDGGQCQACGEAVELRDAQIDHIRARGMGGGFRDDSAVNLRTLCLGCHGAKHGQALAELGAPEWLRRREAAS